MHGRRQQPFPLLPVGGEGALGQFDRACIVALEVERPPETVEGFSRLPVLARALEAGTSSVPVRIS